MYHVWSDDETTSSRDIPQSDRITARHNPKTIWNTLTTTTSTSPSFLVQVRKSHRPDCICLRSPPKTFIPTDPDWFTSRSNIGARFSVAHSSPDRSTRGSFRQGSSHVPSSLSWHRAAPRSSQKAFFHHFATWFCPHLNGISLVYLKFSARDTLLQMYPPDVKHTPTETSCHMWVCVFFFENLIRRRLISVFHLFGSFARIPLGSQWRISQGRTCSSLWHVFLPVIRWIFPHQVVDVIQNVLVLSLSHANGHQQWNTL